MDVIPEDAVTSIAFDTILHNSFDDAACGVVWLGYANVLFMSLMPTSETVNYLPGETTLRRELSTHYCSWVLCHESQQICTASDSREMVLAEFEGLKSRPIVKWNVDRVTWTLDLMFTNGWSVRLIPWHDKSMSAEELASDAWVVQVDNRYYAVSCGGELTVQATKRSR